MTWFARARAAVAGMAGAAVFSAVLLVPGHAAGNERSAELLRAGYQAAYNLDYEDALAAFRSAVEADPDDPAAYRAMAALTWLNLMFSRGALSSDEFLSSMPESNAGVKPPPAGMAAAFRANLDKAVQLAEAQVRSRPRDAGAYFNLGSAQGLLAAYTVSIEGSLFGAVRLARSAFKAHERVLALDPSRKDASFFTGSYRYAVANLGSVKRLLAYMAGFGGDRQLAIRMLEESAAYRSDVQVDAMVLLALIYNRERRYDDASRLLQDLRLRLPRNRLLWLESASTELRAGRPIRALEFLDAGIAMFEHDPRPKAFGEAAMWYAKRGAAYTAIGSPARADADLRRALAAEGRRWVHGRAHLELGKLADVSGNRTAAVAEYRRAAALCGADRDPVARAEAERWINEPYPGTKAAPGRQ
jgi:tetratricopeptide (TPR) repeat protein